MEKSFNVSIIIYFIAMLVMLNSKQTTVAQTVEKKKLVPKVTIPAPPGSKGLVYFNQIN
jgi:hypothetical protein